MGFWFEAWTLPHETPYERKIAYLPVLSASIEGAEDALRVECSITLPAAFERLSEVITVDQSDHSNDVGSLIKCFHSDHLDTNGKPTPVVTFEAKRVSDELVSEPTSAVVISGPIQEAFLNWASTYPYDFPREPSIEGPHVWGGDNELANPGFEELSFSNEIQSVHLGPEPTAGTFTLTDPITGTDTTPSIAFDTTTENLRNQVLAAWQDVFDVNISGSGIEEDPWLFEFVDPGGVLLPLSIVLNDSSVTPSGQGAVAVTQQGGVPDASPWEKTYLYHVDDELGTYLNWEPSQVKVRTGDWAFRIRGSDFCGLQQPRQVIPGHRYNAHGYVNPNSGSDPLRIVIRSYQEYLYASSTFNGTYTANVWSKVDVGTFVPTDSRIIFRAAYVGVPTSDFIYWDDFHLAKGDGPATLGDILLALYNDAAVDHVGAGRGASGVLSWLVPTFDGTNDSNGDPWDATRTFQANIHDPLGELVEQAISEWGYQTRVWYDSVNDVWKWDMFNPGGLGTDNSADDDFTITIGKDAIVSGPLVKKGPDYTSFLGTDSNLNWSQWTETTLETAWGRRESGQEFDFVSTPTDLDDIALARQAVLLESMISMQLNFASASPKIPGVHYKIGDRISVNLGSKYPLNDRVVKSWRVDIGERGRITGMTVSLGADVFGSMGFAGLSEGVRRLLTKLKRKKVSAESGLGSFGKNQGIPWLVAAPTSPAIWQEVAGFVGDGINDLDAVQAAIDAVETSEQEIWMAPGYFVHQASGIASTPMVQGGISGTTIKGAGIHGGGTYIDIQGTPGDLERVFEDCSLEDIWIQDSTDGSEGIIGALLGTQYLSVERCQITAGAFAVVLATDNTRVENCVLNTLGYAQSVLQRACIAITGTVGDHVRLIGNFLDSGGDGRAIVADNIGSGGTNDIQIVGNFVFGVGSGYNGFDIEAQVNANGAPGVLVADNSIWMNASAAGMGIYCEGLHRARIVGNTVYRSGEHGIMLTQGIGNSVRDNLIIGAGQATANTWDGIHLGANEDKAVVTGNQIDGEGQSRYGLNVSAATCDDCMVPGNFLQGTFGTSSFNNSGTNTVTAIDGNGQYT